MMPANLENLYGQRWYKDVLCILSPDEFLTLASELTSPFEKTIKTLVVAMKKKQKSLFHRYGLIWTVE